MADRVLKKNDIGLWEKLPTSGKWIYRSGCKCHKCDSEATEIASLKDGPQFYCAGCLEGVGGG